MNQHRAAMDNECWLKPSCA